MKIIDEVLMNMKKIEESIKKIKNLEKLEVSDIEDKLNELSTLRDSIILGYEQEVNILKHELKSIEERIIVDKFVFNLDDNEFKGEIYNKFKEKIGTVVIKDIKNSFMQKHYDLYKRNVHNPLGFKEYVYSRLGYSKGVSIDKFKLYLSGIAYPVKVEYE